MNDVQDNYPGCNVIPTPWQTEDEKPAASNSSESETEEDSIPSRKRTSTFSSI